MLICSFSADLLFSEAAARYLRLRSIASTPGAATARYIRKNTEDDYAQKLASVSLFFGDTRLSDIHWWNMRSYQETRLAGAEPFVRYRHPQDKKSRTVNGVTYMAKGKTPCPAKAKQVNQEMRLVKKLKTLAGCWTANDEAFFQHLQVDESDKQRALRPDEQQLWLDLARSNPRWADILGWSVVSFDLICSPGELRGLQLGHVNLNQNYQMVRIPWAVAKNPFRHRDIPIAYPETSAALERFIQRAGEMGARDPHHYLFPFKITRKKSCDPSKSMTESGFKKLWQEVRDASRVTVHGVKYDLSWFRMEDTRHTGATRMAESGIPAPVIMTRMGHSNLKMQQHYQHITEQAQRMWMQHAQQFPPRIPPRSDHGNGAPWSVGNYFQNKY